MLTTIIRSVMFMKQDCTNTVSPRSCLSNSHSETSSDAFGENKEKGKQHLLCFSLLILRILGKSCKFSDPYLVSSSLECE